MQTPYIHDGGAAKCEQIPRKGKPAEKTQVGTKTRAQATPTPNYFAHKQAPKGYTLKPSAKSRKKTWNNAQLSPLHYILCDIMNKRLAGITFSISDTCQSSHVLSTQLNLL